VRNLTYVDDRYGFDVFSNDPHSRNRPTTVDIPVRLGLVIEDVESGFVGEVSRIEQHDGQTLMQLTDRYGMLRMFPLGSGYWIDGKPVNLIPPVAAQPAPSQRTASGSRHIRHDTRVARGSRIWVEGRHDAELVEKIWGDDLRYEGVVVEYLEGVDHLITRLRTFNPSPSRRVGVLVDHLVPGSKESRLADAAHEQFSGVLVVGHPFLDVWQAIKPEVVGLSQWPEIPRGVDPKIASLGALGLPHSTREDIAIGWQSILARVTDFRDLSPALLRCVEELVDFVTGAGAE